MGAIIPSVCSLLSINRFYSESVTCTNHVKYTKLLAVAAGTKNMIIKRKSQEGLLRAHFVMIPGPSVYTNQRPPRVL